MLKLIRILRNRERVQQKRKGPAPKLFKNEACRVCGERAEGMNYNAISCMACKVRISSKTQWLLWKFTFLIIFQAFYHRVVVAGKALSCIFPETSENIPFEEKRARCRHCRLEACHLAGMKPEYVTLEKKPSLLNFSNDTLNTQQENLLNTCKTFWKYVIFSFFYIQLNTKDN